MNELIKYLTRVAMIAFCVFVILPAIGFESIVVMLLAGILMQLQIK